MCIAGDLKWCKSTQTTKTLTQKGFAREGEKHTAFSYVCQNKAKITSFNFHIDGALYSCVCACMSYPNRYDQQCSAYISSKPPTICSLQIVFVNFFLNFNF